MANNAQICLNRPGQPVAIEQKGDAAVKANAKIDQSGGGRLV